MKHKKMSLVAQKIGQTFRDPVKKNQLFISNSLGSYNFFNEAVQPRFFAKKMTLVKNDDR
jgi:hypothetical protein